MDQANQVSVQIDEDGTDEPGRSQIRTDQARPIALNRHNVGLSDRLNNVFREIRPLVENARMGNNSRLSLPTWLPRHSSHQLLEGPQRPASSIAHVNLGPNAQSFIVTERGSPMRHLNNSVSNESNVTENSQPEQPEINISVNPSNNDNIDNDSQSDDDNAQVVDVRSLLNVLIKYAPFYFILFLKFIYDSREGLFAFVVLLSAFIHSNIIVRREHAKQMNRNILTLLIEIIFTISCVFVIHVIFGHGILLPNVIMFPNYNDNFNVWELIWLVVLTDLIVKLITVNVKIVVTVLPASLLPFQKRGKVYLFVESVSQLYRSVLTIQPWVYFLMESYSGSEKMIGMFLTSIYVISKAVEVLVRLRLFKSATWTLLQSVNLGTKPTNEQLQEAGDSCPICHDDYTTPVRLGCGHIFCELCIAAWLDREHTCPLCRAKVADEPTWRDGTTSYDFQLY